MLRRLAAAAVLVLALPAAGAARPDAGPAPAAPQGLRGFLLKADEPLAHSFPRTPSFAWTPVRERGTYQFELAMSQTFDDSQILFRDDAVGQPAIAVPLQLPWMTGAPYALWAHVRFHGADGRTTAWSAPFGFNMRWRERDCGAATPHDCDIPQQLPAPAGLVRWTPIAGATAYDVVYTDFVPTRTFQTTTNVADERELYTFHQAKGLGAVHWRVRAVRALDAAATLTNRLPRVSYGPWSRVFTSTNPAPAAGALTPAATISDTYDRAGDRVQPHDLTPGFAWNGTQPAGGADVGSPLYRVYVYTDDHCVNKVFTGAVVGSPAYAPRTFGGPLKLPSSLGDLKLWQGGTFTLGGNEGDAFDADGEPAKTNEVAGNTLGEGAAKSGSAAPTAGAKTLAGVDLWDSGWPNGRYYWTVVPVAAVLNYHGDPLSTPSLEYHDVGQSQDACEAGRLMAFGKVSQPVVAEASTPYASGMSPDGRVVAAAQGVPLFHDSPLVAWEPVPGGRSYEVQWSQRRYPWRAAGTKETVGTSFTLPLRTPGLWYYRVRGINPSLPDGAQHMTWSRPVSLRITGPVFQLVR